MTITNEEEYQKALARLDEIFYAEPHTPEEIEAMDLQDAIVEYEDKYYNIPDASKEEVRAYLVEQGTNEKLIEKILKETFDEHN